MGEAAACEHDGHVLRVVIAGVSEVASQQDGRVVEQARISLIPLLKLVEERGDVLHQGRLDALELGEFVLVLSVVAEAVVTLLDTVDGWNAVAALKMQGDEARGIGLQREGHDIEHDALAAGQVGVVGDVGGWRGVDGRFGTGGPSFGFGEATLDLPDVGEPGVEFFAIGRSEVSFEAFGVLTHGIHDALSELEPVDLTFSFSWRPLDEEFGEEAGRGGFGRDHGAAPGVG